MTSNLGFFGQVLKNYRMTGCPMPSQRFLNSRMTSVLSAPSNKPRCIVELGTGDGCITEYILDRSQKQDSILSIELNPEMIKIARERLKDLQEFNQVEKFPLEGQNFLSFHIPFSLMK